MRGAIRVVLLAAVAAMLVIPPPLSAGTGPRATPPPPSGDWIVNDTTAISGTPIVLNGNLIVQSAGMLTLTGVDLTINCNYPGQYRIEIQPGGELHMVGGVLSASNSSRGYYFRAAPGSILEIRDSRVSGAGAAPSADGSTSGMLVRTSTAIITGSDFSGNFEALHLRDCALSVTDCTFSGNEIGLAAHNTSLTVTGCAFNGSRASGLFLSNGTTASVSGSSFGGNFRYGICVNGSRADVSGCVFWDNYMGFHADYSNGSRVAGCTFQGEKYAGIRFWQCPAGTVSGCTVNDSKRIALYAAGSRVQAMNTSFLSGMYDAYLEDGALVETVNCTINSKNVFFHDAADRLNAAWYLDIRVLRWSSEAPVGGAAVNVTDQGGNTTFKGATNSTGALSGGVAPGYSMNSSGKRAFGPYTARAAWGGLAASNTTWVNGTMELTLLLDDIGPSMLMDRPAQGSYVNTTLVNFTGSAWDNETAVARIEGSVDNGTWIFATGTFVWWFTAPLADGPHVARIRGTDTSGNTNIAAFGFTVDTRAPALCITSPRDGNLTRERLVNITGVTEAHGNATVSVAGVPAAVDNATGNFSATAGLVEGDNIITIEATDRAGNVARRDLLVRSDTMVSPFEVWPADGTGTNQSAITVCGTVEPGSVIIIRIADGQGNFTGNGTTFNVTSGNFSVNITLHNGTNLLMVQAFDGYGNSAAYFANITQDMTPPAINLTSPAGSVYATNNARLVFKGRVEKDVELFLNGRKVLLDDGAFDVPKTLREGSNPFTLTAVDRAGNVNTIEFNVTYDRTPPPLSVKSPRDHSVIKSGSVLVTGTTESCATVMINGKRARPNAAGNFKLSVPLKMGHNSIDVVATDPAGNPATEHLAVDRAQSPPLLYDWQIGLLTIVAVLVGFAAIVAWDTHRTTGRWALKRPAWLRVPDRVKGYIPRPAFGREEFDSGPRAVSGAPGKEGREPQKHGAPPPPAPAAPPAQPAGQPPAAKLGDEFIVSEKTVSALPGTMPAATEVPAQLPVAEPVAAAPAAAADVTPGPAPTPGPAGEPTAPAGPPAQPAPAPAPPPKPEEPDPLAEILGHPTKKL